VVVAGGCIQSQATHRIADKGYWTTICTLSIVALPCQPFLQTQKVVLKNLSTLLRGGLGEN
jgi:hypothetical protein